MSEQNSAQEALLSEQRYTMLTRIITALRENAAMSNEMERKRHLQELTANLEIELREAGRHLNKNAGDLYGPLYNAFLAASSEVMDERLLKQLKAHLLEKTQQPFRTHLMLQGETGSGKSFMAALLARDEEVRKFFRDGVFWISLGPAPDLLAAQINLIRKLGDFDSHFQDSEEAAARIEALSDGRNCLFILDDAWDIKDVMAFKAGGKHSQLLITSSHPELFDFVKYSLPSSKGYDIALLNETHALQLLLQCADKADMDTVDAPQEAAELANNCAGNALVLKLTGSALPSMGGDWGTLLESFKEAVVDVPEGYSETLWRALQVNLDSLGEDADYYYSLAVFVSPSHIPQTAVAMLWSYMFNLQEEQVYERLNQFAARGLLNISGNPPLGDIHLHPFQYEYLQMDSDDKLHTRLLTAYRRRCPTGWVAGPNDGYFFQHLCAHLHYAKRNSELKSLLMDFEWLYKKIQHAGMDSLTAEFEYLTDPDLTRVRRALLEDDNAVAVNSAEDLAAQLFKHLLQYQDESKDIQALLNQAREVVPDWEPPHPGK